MSRPPDVVPASKRRCGGVFTPDPDVPPDPLSRNARRVCRCGLIGQPGDAHHDVPDVPEPDVQQRRTGERGDRP